MAVPSQRKCFSIIPLAVNVQYHFFQSCLYRLQRIDATAVAFRLALPSHNSLIKAQSAEQPECSLSRAGPSLAFTHLCGHRAHTEISV